MSELEVPDIDPAPPVPEIPVAPVELGPAVELEPVPVPVPALPLTAAPPAANAIEELRAKTEANAIVVSFMVVSLVRMLAPLYGFKHSARSRLYIAKSQP
jgi:hypothetical protein